MSTSLIRNLKSTARSVVLDLGDSLKGTLQKNLPDLDEREKEILARLKVDGFCVLEGYWQRERASNLRTRLYEQVGENDMDFEGGAYLRHRSGSAYDEGIVRINHVDKLIPDLRDFRFDPLPLRIAHAYYGRPFYSGMLIFQHNPESTSVTRTFHVDCFGKEFKSFLYLDDVDESNGPFTYIRGSHRNHLIRIKKQIFGNPNDAATTFFEQDVRRVKDREVKITGGAGSLVLADVRGFHRGSPQKGKSRAVLVNYIIGEQVEIFTQG